MRSSLGVGTAGERVGRYARVEPRGARIIYCHGSGSSASAVSVDPSELGFIREATELGEVFAADLGGETWGNDLAVSRIDSYVGDGPAILVGISMGGCNALNYARAHPDKVVGVAGVIPLVDLEAARQFAGAAIDAAHPGGGSAGRSPVNFAADLPGGMPIHLWTSSDDPLLPPSAAEAFVEARPQTGLTSLGAVGHGSWAAALAIPTLMPFLRGLA